MNFLFTFFWKQRIKVWILQCFVQNMCRDLLKIFIIFYKRVTHGVHQNFCVTASRFYEISHQYDRLRGDIAFILSFKAQTFQNKFVKTTMKNGHDEEVQKIDSPEDKELTKLSLFWIFPEWRIHITYYGNSSVCIRAAWQRLSIFVQ